VPEQRLTDAQRDLLASLMVVWEAVAKNCYREVETTRKRGRERYTGTDDRRTEGDYVCKAGDEAWAYIAKQTNADATPIDGRPLDLFTSHLAGRVKSRLKNYRRDARRHARQREKYRDDENLNPNHAGTGSRGVWVTVAENDKTGERWPTRQRLPDLREIGEEPPPPSLDHDAVKAQVAAALARMREIDPEATECFRLWHGEGLKHREIAERTGLSVPQVKRRIVKAESIAEQIREDWNHEHQRIAG
jgi:RNA polymerase sigma factor (sigma-70 family)